MIPDSEITLMLPGGSPGLDYCRSMVRLARLAGMIYEKLYSVQAVASLQKHVPLPVQRLSQEVDAVFAKSQKDLVGVSMLFQDSTPSHT